MKRVSKTQTAAPRRRNAADRSEKPDQITPLKRYEAMARGQFRPGTFSTGERWRRLTEKIMADNRILLILAKEIQAEERSAVGAMRCVRRWHTRRRNPMYVKGHMGGINPLEPKQHGDWTICGRPCKPEQRIFACHMAECISWSDRCQQEHGDYKPLARLFYASLELWTADDCPAELREIILADAALYKRGQWIRVSTCGQTRQLGILKGK